MPTVKELKQEARSKGIVGFSRMRKADLEKALQDFQNKQISTEKSLPAAKVLPKKSSPVEKKVLSKKSFPVVKTFIKTINNYY